MEYNESENISEAPRRSCENTVYMYNTGTGILVPSQVIIETTGMADPAPVAQTFFVSEDVQAFFRLDGLETLRWHRKLKFCSRRTVRGLKYAEK